MKLYLHTHTKTGVKQLGYIDRSKMSDRTRNYIKENSAWGRHLQTHGNTFTTEILLETEDQFELSLAAINHSIQFKIWDNPNYANQMMENGLPGAVIKKFRSDSYNENAAKAYLKISEEDRNRKGESNGMHGKHHSEETKIKQRLVKLGKKATPEAKRNMSKAQRGRVTSEETKLKQSISAKGKNAKPLIIDGLFFKSGIEAASYLNISRNTVSIRCKSNGFPNYEYALKGML